MRQLANAFGLSILTCALAVAGCGGDDSERPPDARPQHHDPDSGMTDVDSGMSGIDAGMPDAGTDVSGIAAARAAEDGTVDIQITDVHVTYVTATESPAGFYVQAVQTGPALFIAVDLAILDPVPAVGDIASFKVTEMDTFHELREAKGISDLVVSSSGNDISGLVQDLSAATDTVSAVGSYQSEVVTVTGTITGDFEAAGGGHSSATVDTAGVTGDANFLLRVPDEVITATGASKGCTFTVTATPMGQFDAEAQLTATEANELTITNCPGPSVTSALATSKTEVVVSFSRAIDPASVTSGDQFSFDNGLTASAPVTNGNTVTLTTTDQTPGTTYTVTVANTVTDTDGQGIEAGGESTTFTGFSALAVLRINEINGIITNGCDLVELRVVKAGSLENVTFSDRESIRVTFPAMDVETNDYIVVHFGNAGNCNPNNATQETTAPDEQPADTFAGNFDSAFDFWISESGMPGTDNVLTTANPGVGDALGTIQDAVLVTNGDGDASGTSEGDAADVAAAGEWTTPAGDVPADGFVDADFDANAVANYAGTDKTSTGTSLQRNDNDDNNNKDDWATAPAAQTWGADNLGQS